MSSVRARELGRGPEHGACFELERKGDNHDKGMMNLSLDIADGNAAAAAEGNQEETGIVIVKCEDEAKRDLWLKSINDQINHLQSIANTLTNPQGAGRESCF